jgi:hypothetical protein
MTFFEKMSGVSKNPPTVMMNGILMGKPYCGIRHTQRSPTTVRRQLHLIVNDNYTRASFRE